MSLGAVLSGVALSSIEASVSEAYNVSLQSTINAHRIERVFATLLTIEHEDLEEPVRVCDDYIDLLSTDVPGIISRGMEFIQFPFSFVLPNQEEDSPPRAKLTIDNVSREIIAVLSQINSPPTIKFELILSDAPDVVEIVYDHFRLNSVSFDALTIEGELVIEQFESEMYPKGSFIPSGFPGLYRGSVTEETI